MLLAGCVAPSNPHSIRPLSQFQQEELLVDNFSGTVQLFAFDFVPRGWRHCDGAQLPVHQHPALFSLLGNRFGGNPGTTFALPDLRNQAPASGLVYAICVDGVLPPRA